MKYLRTDKLPTLWCWGCGDGIVMKAMVKAFDALGWDKDDICVVSGIGCSGRMSGYIDANTVHTTHGRALAYATGIKLANPDKHVIVVTGDGDGLAIGASHTIHAARRNIGLKHIFINNFIYGLTNSQTSPTTPKGFRTSTATHGNIDPPFDAAKLLIGAGASFVGRESVTKFTRLEKLFIEGFKHDGYSFFDVFTNCHVNLGKKNKMREATEMLEWLDKICVSKAKFESLSDKTGYFQSGVLHKDESLVEYTKAYYAENINNDRD